MSYGFRKATPKDRSKLLKLLADGKDVPLYWRNKYVINNRINEVYVVDMMGQLIGMTHLAILPQNEAWLESAYIHPNYRGKGVGSRFSEYAIEVARQEKVVAVRLATGINNTRVHHLIGEKSGFEEYSEWYRVRINKEAGYSLLNEHSPYQIKYPKVEDAAQIWQYIRNHTNYHRSNKLMTMDYDPYMWGSLNFSALKRLLTQGLSMMCLQNGKIAGVYLISKYIGFHSKKPFPMVLQTYTQGVQSYSTLLARALELGDVDTPLLLSSTELPNSIHRTLLRNAGDNLAYRRDRWVIWGKRLK